MSEQERSGEGGELRVRAGESLDDWLGRSSGSSVAASVRRMAWALAQPGAIVTGPVVEERA